MTSLEGLQRWFEQQCDGNWEHEHTLRIETLDNPGWAVFLDLRGTALEKTEFVDLNVQRTDNNWIVCRTRSGRFEGFGGPANLGEIVSTFLNWAKIQNLGDDVR